MMNREAPSELLDGCRAALQLLEALEANALKLVQSYGLSSPPPFVHILDILHVHALLHADRGYKEDALAFIESQIATHGDGIGDHIRIMAKLIMRPPAEMWSLLTEVLGEFSK